MIKNIKTNWELLWKSVHLSIFCSEELFDNFVKNVDLLQLSEVDKNTLEGELTVEELRQILKTFSNGKSPGEDRFTIEFYVQFFELLAPDLPDLLASLNPTYFHGETSISQRRGVITLIMKDHSNLLELSSCAQLLYPTKRGFQDRFIASRIKKVLPLLIFHER